MRKPFTYKLVGSFKKIVFLFLCVPGIAFGDDEPSIEFAIREPAATQSAQSKLTPPAPVNERDWSYYNRLLDRDLRNDRTNGISYIISGGIALAGGIAGADVTSDPLEKGIYALFQTIGIASVGYGAYKWQIGSDERTLLLALKNSTELNDSQRLSILKSFYGEKAAAEKKERFIKAVTHGLIAALNFYNASSQTQEGVKSTLNFIGGANLLAALSYTF